jgi:hypothetical protein
MDYWLLLVIQPWGWASEEACWKYYHFRWQQKHGNMIDSTSGANCAVLCCAFASSDSLLWRTQSFFTCGLSGLPCPALYSGNLQA